MMTKEDYMHLPKERLAELLAERDKAISIQPYVQPYVNIPYVQVDNDSCPYGGKCLNKFKDCIGCPKGSITYTYSSTCTEDDKKEK